MAGYLTTHVLDIAQGRPAAGMRVEVWWIDSLDWLAAATQGERRLLKQVYTNAEGRTDSPLLNASEFGIGVYELVFAVGDYFTGQGQSGDSRPFLDMVPIRFTAAEASAHYHIPLLTSPWAYSTYRGS
jgi:5-hydroxyisourate hydrolase